MIKGKHGGLVAQDPFLKRCRLDRADYRRYLESVESGRLHIGDAALGGGAPDRTSAFADHLRRLIAQMDAVIEDLEGRST